MDPLAAQLQHIHIKHSSPKDADATNSRTAEEAARADKLIRELQDYADNKVQSTTTRWGRGNKRSLVHANHFELDLEHERKRATTSAAATEPRRDGRRDKGNSSVANRHDPFQCHIDTLHITSWRLNEFEYVKGTLPTLARGLFTYQDPCSSTTTSTEAGIYRILLRGYDKFFNIGEVDKTQPLWLANNTEGPYEVTLKENGCIIFMSGLDPKLVGPQGGCVVSSKHFMGDSDPNAASHINRKEENWSAQDHEPPQQQVVAHSAKGREWLEKSLKLQGKSLQDFGLWLWYQNLTAVAELCDDSFEEHVLQYTTERAGLYLHGLNRNTADFQTLPSDQVQAAAKLWGLRLTDYVTFNTYKEVMDFTDKVRNAGEFDNRPVEGFVVRCKTKDFGDTFFFKIKYDEPYLMYREWREITKRLWSIESKKIKADTARATTHLEVGGKTAPPNTLRMRYPLTRAYVDFVSELMRTQPELFTGYNKNQGIILIRDMFLQAWEVKSTKEQEALLAIPPATGSKASSGGVAEEDFQRTVLIPIATIGCGKTTVSVALSKLFGWAHVSSDDFHHMGKNPGQKFTQEIVNKLKENMVVIADRNNHEFLHREQIMSAVQEVYPKTRFVALYWAHDELPLSIMREMQIDRVRNRGSNHQSLTPDYCPDFEFVIQRFLKSFQPLNPMVEPDSKFTQILESKVGEESIEFVRRIIKEFAMPTLGAGGIGNHAIPTDAEIEKAVKYSMEEWKPLRVTTGEAERYHQKKLMKSVAKSEAESGGNTTPDSSNASTATVIGGKRRKVKEPKYFAIALEMGVVPQVLDELLDGSSRDSAEWSRFQDTITTWRENHRIGPNHHLTLIHTSARKDWSSDKARRAENLWKAYTEEVAGLTITASSTADGSDTTLSTASPDMSSLVSSLEQSLSLASALSPQTKDNSHDKAEDEGEFTEVVRNQGRKGRKGRVAQAGAPTADAEPVTPPPSASATSPSMSRTSTLNQVGRPDLLATVKVDYVIWTDRIMALRVCSAKRVLTNKPYETTQATLHITVGTAGDHVKPYESNAMLRLWRPKAKHVAESAGGSNADAATPAEPDIYAIKLDKPKVFSGQLRAMMF